MKTKHSWSCGTEWRVCREDTPKRASFVPFFPDSETQLRRGVLHVRECLICPPISLKFSTLPLVDWANTVRSSSSSHLPLTGHTRARAARRSKAFELRSCHWSPYWVRRVNRWSKYGDLGKGDIRRGILDLWDGPGHWPPRLPPTGQLLLPGTTWAADRRTYSL